MLMHAGVAHGQRFAREIADNVATYLRRFAASGLDRDEAFAEAETLAQGDRHAEPRLCRGDAGDRRRRPARARQAIALLNARYELAFTLFGQEATAPWSRRESCSTVGPDGCTTFGLEPEVTADRHTWLGQNWDWLEGVHGRTFVLQRAAKGQAELRLPHRSRDRRRQDGRQRMRDRPGRERPRLEPRRPQSLSQAVPRALPRSAGRRKLRRGVAAA